MRRTLQGIPRARVAYVLCVGALQGYGHDVGAAPERQERLQPRAVAPRIQRDPAWKPHGPRSVGREHHAPLHPRQALAGEDDPDLDVLRGWRHEVFGRDALRIREGKLALVARPGGVEVLDISED